jgi:hypothetical protein
MTGNAPISILATTGGSASLGRYLQDYAVTRAWTSLKADVTSFPYGSRLIENAGRGVGLDMIDTGSY